MSRIRHLEDARPPMCRRTRRWLLGSGRGSVVGGLVVALSLAMPTLAEAGPKEPAGAAAPDDPCDGLFAVMDRPTVADSSCSVKPGRLLTELGYTNASITGSDSGRATTYPQAALRYGLIDGLEIRLFPPIYNMTDVIDSAGGGRLDGLGDTAFGAKYQIGTFGGITIATDARLTVPTVRSEFSAGGVQGNVQGIASFNLTPKLGILVQVGASSLASRLDDDRVHRFGNFGANLVLGYQVNDRFQLFSELFGNTASGPGSRGNLSYLGGAQYLVTKSIEVDIGAGALISGPQGQPARFFQIGTGLLF